jgi:hypothetical protein
MSYGRVPTRKQLIAALAVYADPKNWGNGGWEGHKDVYWRGPSLRGNSIARLVLAEVVDRRPTKRKKS